MAAPESVRNPQSQRRSLARRRRRSHSHTWGKPFKAPGDRTYKKCFAPSSTCRMKDHLMWVQEVWLSHWLTIWPQASSSICLVKWGNTASLPHRATCWRKGQWGVKVARRWLRCKGSFLSRMDGLGLPFKKRFWLFLIITDMWLTWKISFKCTI